MTQDKKTSPACLIRLLWKELRRKDLCYGSLRP